MCLHFVLHIILFPTTYVLYFYISTFRSTSLFTVPSVAAFCGSLSCFPVTLRRYFLCDFDMVTIARTITDTSSVFVYYCYITCVTD